jgi:hypothetical protein
LENVVESESKFGRPVAIEMRDALLRFIDPGSVPDWYLPQGSVGAAESLKPRVTLAQQFHVHRLVDEMAQRLH